MLVFLALGDAEVLSFALGDAKVPNARYFAFWWNIGFTVYSYSKWWRMHTHSTCLQNVVCDVNNTVRFEK